MLEKGYKVFLWQKLMGYIIKNKSDKQAAKEYFIKIKDLNKLVQEMKNTEPYEKLKLWKYYSDDSFDKLFLDYTLYPDNRNKFDKKNYAKNKNEREKGRTQNK